MPPVDFEVWNNQPGSMSVSVPAECPSGSVSVPAECPSLGCLFPLDARLGVRNIIGDAARLGSLVRPGSGLGVCLALGGDLGDGDVMRVPMATELPTFFQSLFFHFVWMTTAACRSVWLGHLV